MASNLVMTLEYVCLQRYIGMRDSHLTINILLTYSMEQSPSWEVNRFAASQETPRILWNPKVHYRLHKYLPPVSILSQLDPVHTPTSKFVNIHINIILPSTSESPKWSLSLKFPHQDPIHASPFMRYMLRLFKSFNFITRKNLGEEYRSLSSSLCSPLHSLLTLSLLGPNILLNTLFSNTLHLLSFVIFSDQVSHPYETTAKLYFRIS